MDAESESCEFAKSHDAEKAFVSILQVGHGFRSCGWGGTEGLDCEIGGIETWVVDSAAARHTTPNSVLMTNYRECDSVVRVTNGVSLPMESVGGIFMCF